jgi:hypothetical protein
MRAIDCRRALANIGDVTGRSWESESAVRQRFFKSIRSSGDIPGPSPRVERSRPVRLGIRELALLLNLLPRLQDFDLRRSQGREGRRVVPVEAQDWRRGRDSPNGPPSEPAAPALRAATPTLPSSARNWRRFIRSQRSCQPMVRGLVHPARTRCERARAGWRRTPESVTHTFPHLMHSSYSPHRGTTFEATMQDGFAHR